ncbi:ETX/MTX2 family pore-forming toxin [Bacillus cereus]|uniref:ETX/MTX2 family pore-forming toxin n=1 Tax=Bacillus cereus TaxID=1396 RepID=UPI002D77ADA4|nr:ETX/MTX2 family pore-forming toxin [Bacillus cereus]MEC2744418.1 ETX/MTX2 family pore-forming toxin [Bacillus cereus]MEC2755563.1 ETX/MTX2 family pore-forming toxin [Bacillus cereus]MEC2830298.1 ETX/MTX2 family pore-forming toxin [Bacillus cereus]
MKNSKKLKRKILACGAIASIGTTFVTSSPILASADQINISELERDTKVDTAILEWKVPLFKATEIYGKNIVVPSGYVYDKTWSDGYVTSYKNLEYHQFSVESDGSPIITNSNNIFVGKTTLTNNTNQEQTLSTNSFSKMISNSVTHSTTHGFKFGTKASAKFKIPFVGETSIELSAEYNFSDTSSETNSESFTYIATPQNIKVPAHSSVEVVVNLDTVKAKGDVKLLAKMSGEDTGSFSYKSTTGGIGNAYVYNRTFNSLVAYASRFEKLQNISANPDGKTVNIIGSGKYEAEYGTEFNVTVTPIDKNGKSVDEGYTYKVKPEITKEK